MQHKPHFSQFTSVFRHSHNMVRSGEKRFAMERMATRGFASKKSCARMATWRRATLGDHVARRLVCVSCPCVFRFTSLETRFVCGSKGKNRSALVPHHLDCSRAVLHSRLCLQTSAGVWNRAQPASRITCRRSIGQRSR